MRRLTVLYDPQCGLCCRVHTWLLSQPKYLELAFLPVQSEEALYRYPKLNHAITLKDVTVIGDDGAVYWGAKAWLMCLWALRNYREWSLTALLAELLPTVRRVVSMISQNRHQTGGGGQTATEGFRDERNQTRVGQKQARGSRPGPSYWRRPWSFSGSGGTKRPRCEQSPSAQVSRWATLTTTSALRST